MAWDTPSVRRGVRATTAVRPVRPVSFGVILGRIAAALAVALVFGWAASWAFPALGATAQRLVELGAGAVGLALALRLQWRTPERPGLPQRVLDRADRPWTGGYERDDDAGVGDCSDAGVGEALVEIVVDIASSLSSD